MISITDKKWKKFFNNIPEFNLNTAQTIFLAPHPDDETLGCGGLIADLAKKCWDIQIISITNGEVAYNDIPSLKEIRINELSNSIKQLGLSEKNILRLNFQDGKIQEENFELEEKLLPYISSGCNLFAPWEKDYHHDHEAVGRVATKLAQNNNIKLYYYFIWTWHHRDLNNLEKLNLKKYILQETTLKRKIKAIECYQSQLTHPSKIPILTNKVLIPFKTTFEIYAPYDKKTKLY